MYANQSVLPSTFRVLCFDRKEIILRNIIDNFKKYIYVRKVSIVYPFLKQGFFPVCYLLINRPIYKKNMILAGTKFVVHYRLWQYCCSSLLVPIRRQENYSFCLFLRIYLKSSFEIIHFYVSEQIIDISSLK